jgi:hypothetical protein
VNLHQGEVTGKEIVVVIDLASKPEHLRRDITLAGYMKLV